MEEPYSNGGVETGYFEGEGSVQPLEESETVVLFRDLEHELELLTQRYHVPPEDLSQLFEVVQSMFEVMDSNKESLDRLEAEKNELEDLWKQEKDKLRAAQRRKLDLECRLEEERLKIESEKTELEKDKVSLQTRVKQLGEQNVNAEQELQRIKERTIREEQMRKELLEEYKRKADIIKTRSLRRTRGKRRLPTAPERRGLELAHSLSVQSGNQLEDSIRSEMFMESTEITTSLLSSDDSPMNSLRQMTLSPSSPPNVANVSLQQELAQSSPEQKPGDMSQLQESPLPENRARSSTPTNQGGSGESIGFEEGTLSGYVDVEEAVTEDMLDILNTPMRAEVEMLQREKGLWVEERGQLEQAIRDLRTDKETIERHNAETLVEVRQLRENLSKLQEEMVDVKAERDEIYGHYLEQPFDEYCITKKELNELLKRHQKTAIELEKEKEEKEKLQRLLASKRSFLERFKERMRKMFARTASDEPVEYNANMELEKVRQRTLSPIPTPLVRSLAPIMDETLKVEKDWLMSCDSHMTKDTLPQWVGQILLQGIDTEMIDAVAVGRVYHSPLQLLPGNMTPPRLRVGGKRSVDMATQLLADVQQLHAEVWVATSEATLAYVEVIDVLAKSHKARQRFVVRPKSKKILCMQSIPGVVEESKEFTDSSQLSQETSWVETSFLGRHPNFTQSMIVRGSSKKRPGSAPQRRRTYAISYVGSTPDLSSCSDPGPLELFGARRVQPQDPAAKLHSDDIIPTDNSLSTINESDRTPVAPPPIIVTTDNYNKQTDTEALFTCDQEDIDHIDSSHNDPDIFSSSTTSIDGQSSRFTDITSTPIPRIRTKQQLPPSPLHQSNSKPPNQGLENHLTVKSSSNSNMPNGGTEQGKEAAQDPVMWIVTDNNMLYFYPTTFPSHKPFNSVQLHTKAVCIEYIKGKVFMGHTDSSLSVYYIDEFSHTWDVENPERISLPSPNLKEVYEVQCIAAVRDRIWVGAGPSIFFLDAELPASREGSIFLDSWRRKPKQILPLEDIVVVTTTSSCLYLFDAASTRLIEKININSIAKLLDLPAVTNPHHTNTTTHTLSTITKVVSDDTNLYIGTSSGKMVTVPITSLMLLRDRAERTELTSPVNFSLVDIPRSVSLSPTHRVGSPTNPTPGSPRSLSPQYGTKSPKSGSPKHRSHVSKSESPKQSQGVDETDGLLNRKKKEKRRRKKKETEAPTEVKDEVSSFIEDEWEELHTAEEEDNNGPYLENTAISLHSLYDSEVLSLVSLHLPENQMSKLKTPSDPIPYHSMPNLTSPFGGRVPISPPIVTYKTLILSVGKGHIEYIVEEDPEAVDESVRSALRERNEAFQLLAWGHKNVLS